MKKWAVKYIEHTTLEERYKRYLKMTGKTEKEVTIKEFAKRELEIHK